MKNKLIFGVTGKIGTGKTYLCNIFEKIALKKGVKFNTIFVDNLRRYILYNSVEARHDLLRKTLSKELDVGPSNNHSLKSLMSNIFNNTKLLNQVNKLLYPEIESLIFDQINNHGTYAIEWSNIIEDGLSGWADNNLLIVTCQNKVRMKRISGGDLSDLQLKSRSNTQMSDDEKIQAAKSNTNMKYMVFDTTHNPNESEYSELFDQLINSF